MTLRLAALALGAVLVACAPDAPAAHRSSASMDAAPASAPTAAGAAPLYYLSLEVSGARVTAAVNDLVVYRSESPFGAAFTSPVNDLLVGKNNRLTVRLDPADPAAYAAAVASGADPLDGVRLTATLVRYPPGVGLVPSDVTAGDTLAVLDLAGAVAEAQTAWAQALAAAVEAAAPGERAALVEEAERSGSLAGALPVTVAAEFDAEDAASFRATLLESAPVADEGAVLDYAERLRDLFAAGDGERLWAEYAQREAEYNRAYPMDASGRPEFIEFTGEYLPGLDVAAHMSFPRSAIVAEPLNGGRQWELRVWRDGEGRAAPGGPSDDHPGARLTPFVAADEEFEMETIVGYRDGQLRVIR